MKNNQPNTFYSKDRRHLRHPDSDLIQLITDAAEAGLNQTQLAQQLGYDNSTISYWLRDFPVYADAFYGTRNRIIPKMIKKVAEHGQKDWRALAWFVDRSTTQYQKLSNNESSDRVPTFGDSIDSQRLENARNAVYKAICPTYLEMIYNTTWRYGCFMGGRGGGKTINAGILYQLYLILHENYNNKQFLNLRKTRVSIEHSTHGSLVKYIKELGLLDIFEVQKEIIINKINGNHITFAGLFDIDNLKSTSDLVFMFFEEASQLQAHEIRLLVKNIRGLSSADDARVVFCYNPRKPVDDILHYCQQRPDSSLIRHINMFDLPPQYQDSFLLQEAASDKEALEIDFWNHEYLGAPLPSYSAEPFSEVITTNQLPEPESPKIVAYIDPSFTGRDYTAISICYVATDHKIAVIGRVWNVSYDSLIKEITDLCMKYNVTMIKYESNGGISKTWAREIQQISNISVSNYNQRQNKFTRIMRLVGTKNLLNRLVFYDEPQTRKYIDSLKNFNADKCRTGASGYYDDAPDSLEGALLLLEKSSVTTLEI